MRFLNMERPRLLSSHRTVARSEAPRTEVVQRRAEAERHGPRAVHRRVAEGHGQDQGGVQVLYFIYLF